MDHILIGGHRDPGIRSCMYLDLCRHFACPLHMNHIGGHRDPGTRSFMYLDLYRHIDWTTLIPNIVVLVLLDHIGSLAVHAAGTLNMGHGK